MDCRALVDTGSAVSTIAEAFYRTHLARFPLKRINTLIEVEGASGQLLPYLGYVELTLKLPRLDIEQPCPFLVVGQTRYNSLVPVLVGTNVLHRLIHHLHRMFGDRFSQKSGLGGAWSLAFHSMQVKARQLERKQGQVGLVKNASRSPIVIRSNTVDTVPGRICQQMVFSSCTAMMHQSAKTKLPQTIEVAPAVITLDQMDDTVPVQLVNMTSQDVVIEPSAIICELQAVDVESDGGTKPQLGEEELQCDLSQCEIDSVQRQGLRKFLQRWHHMFSLSDVDIGRTSTVKHRIDLYNDTPFKQPHRRIPPSMLNEVRLHLKQLLKSKIIRPSHSPWASNVVLVRKSNGELRLCVDYRQLNNLTVPDAYALPRIEELLDLLSGSHYYSVLDLKSGYYQVEIEESHKQRTAFSVGPLGFYEHNRMAFGLRNAPATFQRLMEDCLGDLKPDTCCVYLDDIIVYSRTVEEHLDCLERVFDRLDEYGLKLSPKKCQFFKSKLKYLGYVVSAQGVETDEEKIARVKEWPTPRNQDEVRQFLGFAGYYRKFVRDFSKLAKPLQELVGAGQNKKARRGRKIEPLPGWYWGMEQEAAFQDLKEALTSAPVLAYPEYSLPFVLHTDASGEGLGAVLYQIQDGVKRVIAYASRGLTKAEKNYPAHKLEFLALKWACTKKFHDYLYGNTFEVYSDNNPLTYVLSTAKLDASGHRWLAELACYTFSIKYRAGVVNVDADTLSRLPSLGQSKELDQEAVRAICNSGQGAAAVEALCMSQQVLDEWELVEGTPVSTVDWRQRQDEDFVLREVRRWLEEEQKPPLAQLPRDAAMHCLYREFPRLHLRQGVIYRKGRIQDEECWQLVLPVQFRKMALQGIHDEAGHPGRDRTVSLLRERFFWPQMAAHAEEWVKCCERCIRRKSPVNVRAPLVGIQTTQPMELVCIDYLTLEESKGGYSNVLVITDHYTRYAQAYPTRNQLAETTARVLFEEFFVHYGFPQRIHSDQGRNFESRIIKSLCKLAGIEKSRTTPYHAQGNGMVERFNRTLLGMLGTLDPLQKSNWKAAIRPLVHAYNCTRHDSTGFSPFFLMFGRNPRLPVDVMMGLENPDGEASLPRYVETLRKRLKDAYRLANANAERARKRQKGNFDLKVRGAVLHPGDRVLVKKVAFKGKHKIEDRWEAEPYVILEQPNREVPVFVVAPEKGRKTRRTLHRNLLLPFSSLPLSFKEGEEKVKAVKVVPRKSRGMKEPVMDEPSSDVSLSGAESEPEVCVISTTPAFPGGPDDQVLAGGFNSSKTEVVETGSESSQEVCTDEPQQPHMGSFEEVEPLVDAAQEEALDLQSETEVKTEPSTGVTEVPEPDPETPLPRRSQRNKPTAKWMTSGEYVLLQQTLKDLGSQLRRCQPRPVPKPRKSVVGHQICQEIWV